MYRDWEEMYIAFLSGRAKEGGDSTLSHASYAMEVKPTFQISCEKKPLRG